MKTQRTLTACLLVASTALSPLAFSATTTDTFAGFTMDFVDITGGVTPDDTGYGAVTYDPRMGTHEVSGGMIDAYNLNSGGPAITRDLSLSVSQPATGMSWNQAARFVNWLNTSNGFSPAYKFTTTGGNDDIALWGVGDAGYNSANLFRNRNARYVLPSENEWYRAAYYDPNAGVYWNYATGSDDPPVAVASGSVAGTAVYSQNLTQGPADITNAGGLSPFGTMAQNGNAWEWTESGDTANDWPGRSRVIRGASWWLDGATFDTLVSSFRSSSSPDGGGGRVGFRVAAVPEPSGLLLTLLGAMGLLLKRRRG